MDVPSRRGFVRSAELVSGTEILGDDPLKEQKKNIRKKPGPICTIAVCTIGKERTHGPLT